MTEFIVRLTDEQERALRRYSRPTAELTQEDLAAMVGIRFDLSRQVLDALALYDQLVTEAQAASDE